MFGTLLNIIMWLKVDISKKGEILHRILMYLIHIVTEMFILLIIIIGIYGILFPHA